MDPIMPAVLVDHLLAGIAPLARRAVPLGEAAGLVLAADVVAPIDLPLFTNAAMDGYAVRAADTLAGPVALQVVGVSRPGFPFAGRVGVGEAVAIGTGAAVPAGADAIAPVEVVQADGAVVKVVDPLPVARHIRRRGEDVTAGDVVVASGTELGPGQLVALAALGLRQVPAHPAPRVAIVPTGGELVPPGAGLGPGQIFESVSAGLRALVGQAGGVPAVSPPVADDPGQLMAALTSVAADSDLVVTIGGISAGEWDLVRRLPAPVEVAAVQVALRPARPFAFGRVCGVPLVCLPGNPAAALASFEELVRPLVLRLRGLPARPRAGVRAVLAEPVVQEPGPLHLIRMQVWRDGSGYAGRPAGRHGAAMVHSLAAANAWGVVPAGVGSLPAGAEIEVRLLTEP